MTNRKLPLVSICIPTFNGEKFIAQAMDSAISQSYTNLEIIVSDDASKDETLSVINSYKSKTQIPIYIHNHQPNGIGANWNNCVKNAKGNYIKFLFQDDILGKECVLKMVKIVEANPNVGLVYCKRDFLFEKLTPKLKEFIDYYGTLHTHWSNFRVKQSVLSGKQYLKDSQLLNSPKNKIGEPIAVLLKKECFNKVGFFSEKLQQALDSDFWYRVMRFYDVAFIDEVLVKFRLHDQQASSINKKRIIPDKELVYKNYYRDLFWYLHPKNKLKLLKIYHPVFKALIKLKHKIND
jgi:glycosyltransferase involved in cell wall biosynthesis